MTPYLLDKKLIPEEALKDFAKMQHVLQQIRNKPDGYWSCHSLCVFMEFHISFKLHWKAAHGHFHKRGNCHSWLWVNYKDKGTYIADIYPIAALNPQLIDCGYPSPWAPLYMEDNMYYEDAQKEIWAKDMWALCKQQQESEKLGVIW